MVPINLLFQYIVPKACLAGIVVDFGKKKHFKKAPFQGKKHIFSKKSTHFTNKKHFWSRKKALSKHDFINKK